MNLKAPKGIDVESWFIECYRKHKGHPMQILLGLYKGNYHKFFLAVIFFFIKHAPVWVLPIVTANIINDITSGSPETYQNIMIQAVIMVFLVILNVPMNYMYTRYKSLATRYAETGLRKALVRKLQQLSISYHKETQSGRLQSKIMRDVEAVETLSTQMFLSILSIALNLGLALVVELIPVTRAHALEEEEVSKMSGQLFAVAEKGYRLDVIQSLFGSVGWAIFQVFQVVCLGFTGFLAVRGTVMPGDITLYQSYFATIVSQVSSLMSLIPTIAKGIESVNSIGEVLLEEDIEHNEGKEVIDRVDGEFDFNNVMFRYNDIDRPVLHELNLHVDKGETIALVGESGAGKSTILNLVIGFNQVNQGEVLIDGHNMKDIDLRSYRKHLAVVPQTSILFSGTIRDNITYGVENVDEATLNEVVKAANLTDLIDSLPDGLDTMVGEHGGKLSGGQRQRISIARALIRNPKVIVLDEATSALDSISEKLIQEALNNLTKDRTTFIVAHRLSTIKDADKIAVIADGHCVEYGTYDELMELKGEFYQMKKIQS